MKTKQVIWLFLLLTLSSFLGAFAFKQWFSDEPQTIVKEVRSGSDHYRSVANASELEDGFIKASENSTPSVVFIKTEASYQRRSSFWFFDMDPFGSIGKVASSGSGVIVSSDGYIVTNYHVVRNADKIEAVLTDDRKTYQAKLIGFDQSSDIALLKIEASKLPAIEFANSDEVRIGQWVLAVGNPFNLTSTVTAGIVSAKGRNINIVNDQFPIESFIQTDAAINPGNSGGALVDLQGRLVGVNTAIASKTGSYVGYGFAIPGNIVAKTINDLKEYGQVQRGFLGIDVEGIDGDMSEKLKVENGVLISRVNGTNEKAGEKLQAGDVITSIDGVAITSKSMYDEQLAYRRPGDVVKVELTRDGSKKSYDIKLVNDEGTTELIKRVSLGSEILGAEFEMISKLEKESLKVESGIKVTNIREGKIRKMNIEEGFIFTSINQKKFNDLKSFVEYLENVKGQIRVEGISPNGAHRFLSFYIY
ncbi:PDZ domain-containing protein [bacterium]|nr:PDZ domain-containing protein [bacterium]